MYNSKNVVSINSISDNIDQYYIVNHKIKELEKIKSKLSIIIKTYFTNNNITSYTTNSHKASIRPISRKTLSKELLLEMDIEEETLDLCSIETKYTQLIVA